MKGTAFFAFLDNCALVHFTSTVIKLTFFNLFLFSGLAHRMLSEHNYSAIIGPPCSQVCRHVARLASYLNIPLFNGVCQGSEMDNRQEFTVSYLSIL